MAVILFIGGMKSGKSKKAEERALKCNGRRLYVATAQITDNEMEERIRKHRERRKNLFETLEEPIKLSSALNNEYDVIMIDCLTFWYNNLFYYYNDIKKREYELNSFVNALKSFKKDVILVTNEVGLGIIPENPLARQFIDFSGMANQKIQKISNEVYFVVSGLEVRLK